MTTAPIDPEISSQFDVVGAVRLATEQAKTRRSVVPFSLTQATAGEKFIAVLFGCYLAYAVARLPAVFKVLNIPNVPVPMVLMAGFVGMLILTVPQRTWVSLWQLSPTMRLVVAIAVLALLTAPIGIWMANSIYAFRTRFIIALAIFFCCLVFLRDRKNLRRALMIFTLCVAAVAAKTMIEYKPDIVTDEFGNKTLAVDAQSVEESRVNVGDSLDSNDFGAILATTFPIALWLGFGSFRRRIFWGAIALLFCGAVVLTSSRGAMLGFGAAATVLIGIGARGWRRWLTVIMVTGGVLVFLKMANSGQTDRFTNFGSGDYNMTASEGRLTLWRQGMVWMVKRPWGYGLENYPLQSGLVGGGGRAAHSSWVQYGVELGAAGLVLILALCIGLIRQLLRLRRRAIHWASPGNEAKQEEALAGHFIAMVAAWMVTGSFLSNAYVPLTYMTLGVAAAALLGSSAPAVETTPKISDQKGPPSRRVRRGAVTARDH